MLWTSNSCHPFSIFFSDRKLPRASNNHSSFAYEHGDRARGIGWGLVSSGDLHLHYRKIPAKGVIGRIAPPLGGDGANLLFCPALF